MQCVSLDSPSFVICKATDVKFSAPKRYLCSVLSQDNERNGENPMKHTACIYQSTCECVTVMSSPFAYNQAFAASQQEQSIYKL